MRRWLWLLLVGLILGSGLGAAWLYYFYNPSPPPPPRPAEGRGLIAGQAGGAIDKSAQQPAKATTFKVTMTIPGAGGPATGEGAPGGAVGGRTRTSGQITAPITAGGKIEQPTSAGGKIGGTVPTRTGGAISTTTSTAASVPEKGKSVGGVVAKPPSARPSGAESGPTGVQPPRGGPMDQLKKVIVVDGLTIPPPRNVPPFENDEHPRFTLETTQRQRTVTIKGTTNLAVEGNGLMVNLFRVYREAGDGPQRRADLGSRNVPLYFQDRFQVNDKPWVRDLIERTKGLPRVFPKLASLDKNRIFVEILFTGRRDDALKVPGLTVYPIPGTDRQVYRIVRPIKMGLDPQSAGLLAQAFGSGAEAQPAARPIETGAGVGPAEKKKPVPRPGKGGTSLKIMPLQYSSLTQPTPVQVDFSQATFPDSQLPLILASLSRPTGPVWGLTRVSAPTPLNPADYSKIY